MRNYIALALIAASTSAVMIRQDDVTIENAVEEVAKAADCTKDEVRGQVKARIEGADGDVEKAVDEAKEEFKGKKGDKGDKGDKEEKPAEDALAQEEADAAVESVVDEVATMIENGDKPSEDDKERVKKAAKEAGASEEDIDAVVEKIDGGDAEGMRKEGKKCKGKKGGEESEGDESEGDDEDKPARGEGEEKPPKTEAAQQEADAAVESVVDEVATMIENGDKPSEDDKERVKKAAKEAGASEEDIDAVVEEIEGGDAKEMRKKGKKCQNKKGGDDESADEGDESEDGEDKPARKEGEDKPAREEGDEEKPAREEGSEEKPAKTEAAQQDAEDALDEAVEIVAGKMEKGGEPSDEDKAAFREAAKEAGATDEDIDEAEKEIEGGDATELRKKGKKCKKGGDKSEDGEDESADEGDDEDKPARGEGKPEKNADAQQDEETTDAKPAKGEGEKPAKGEGEEKSADDDEESDEDKPRRHRKCLADAAGDLADELNLTQEDKDDLKAAFEDGDWEGFEEGADIVGDENAEKLFNKLDEAEAEFEGEEAEKPAKGERTAKE